MDEQLAEFQQLLSELATKGPGGSVDLLLRQMTPERALSLRLCAIPHEFDVLLLRKLSPQLSEEEAQDHYETLSRLSMMTTRDRSLTMHEESRRHLFDQWLTADNAAEFATASQRLVQYFDAQVAQLQQQTGTETSDAIESAMRNRMFHLIGASRHEGLEEFERLCRMRRAQLRLGECETLIKLVREYDCALKPLEQAIVAYHEGKLAADRHQWANAEQFYHRVLDANEIPAPLRAKTLCRLGMVHDAQRHWDDASSFFKKGLEIAEARPDCTEQIIHLHINLGSTYRDAGDLHGAEAFLRKGIELAKQTQSLSSVADGYNALGMLYQKLRDTPRAIEAFDTSLKYLEETGDNFRRAQVYNNLGNAYADKPDWPKSQGFFRQSLEITRQAGDNSGQAITLTNLIRVYRAEQQQQSAIDASQDAIRLFAEVRDDYNVAVVKRSLGQIYSGQDVDLARQFFNEAADLFQRCGAHGNAETARQEAREVGKTRWLPWWVIVAIVLFSIFIILLILLATGKIS